MVPTITKGDFSEFGTRVEGQKCTFTFAVKTDAIPGIILYDTATGKEVASFDIPLSMSLGHVFSVTVSGFDFSKLYYSIKADGKLMIDPYARRIIGREKWNDIKRFESNYQVFSGFSSKKYEWKHENPLIPPEELIMYKLHMRGFSMKYPKLSASHRGNYKGLIDVLPTLCGYGFNCLELMPVYEFEDIRFRSHLAMDKDGNTVTVHEEPYGVNYWGYGDGYYFAPKASYFGGDSDPDYHLKELIDIVHGLSMKVILEFSFVNRPIDDVILDALIYWVKEYRVDGFHLLGDGLPIKRIAENPYLNGTMIIYNKFPLDVLMNEKRENKHLFVTDDAFQYPLRRLQNHMDGNAAEFSDILRRQEKGYSYINYAASNTGMTLYDAYSYGEKHNEANGEQNRDGNNYNASSNQGIEGETKNRVANRIRRTAVRTALLSVMMSTSVPMIFEGDASLNSQSGNNNPYCQDNPIGWADFGKKKISSDMRDYLKKLIAFRKKHTVISSREPFRLSDYLHVGLPDISYHGREPWIMGIGNEKKALGILFAGAYGKEEEDDVMLLFNFYYGEETFALPVLPQGRKWFFVNNTGDPYFTFHEEGIMLEDQKSAIVKGGTATILIGKKEDNELSKGASAL